MTAIGKTRVRNPTILICVVALALMGCGDEDFKNDPRAAAPIELTGVIKPTRVIVSPDAVGAGPVRVIISNQTDEALEVILQGGAVREQVGPVYPQDTATIQQTLEPGRYQVRARSDDAGGRVIAAAELRIGARRPASNDRLLLP